MRRILKSQLKTSLILTVNYQHRHGNALQENGKSQSGQIGEENGGQRKCLAKDGNQNGKVIFLKTSITRIIQQQSLFRWCPRSVAKVTERWNESQDKNKGEEQNGQKRRRD